MFSLFHGLWQYLFRKPDVHILIIGLDHAGKTVYNTCRLLSTVFLCICLSLSSLDVTRENKVNIREARGNPSWKDSSDSWDESCETYYLSYFSFLLWRCSHSILSITLVAKIKFQGSQAIFWDLGGQVRCLALLKFIIYVVITSVYPVCNRLRCVRCGRNIILKQMLSSSSWIRATLVDSKKPSEHMVRLSAKYVVSYNLMSLCIQNQHATMIAWHKYLCLRWQISRISLVPYPSSS